MGRSSKKQDQVYDYILYCLRKIYEKEQSKKFIRSTKNPFTSKNAIVKFVFKSGLFVDSSSYTQKDLKPDQISISANTIRKAVDKLEFDSKITFDGTRYQYVPQLGDKLSNHPVLEIAPQLPITIGVPDSILLLTVGNGAAISVSNYLKSQFYNEDIVFIPLGDYILCISLLPNSILQSGEMPKQKQAIHPSVLLRERIKSVLHTFDLRYPNFNYHSLYEIEYLAKYHPQVKKELFETAESQVGNTYRTYSIMQQAISEYTTNHANSSTPTYTKDYIEDNLSDFIVANPDSPVDAFFNDWWDSSYIDEDE